MKTARHRKNIYCCKELPSTSGPRFALVVITRRVGPLRCTLGVGTTYVDRRRTAMLGLTCLPDKVTKFLHPFKRLSGSCHNSVTMSSEKLVRNILCLQILRDNACLPRAKDNVLVRDQKLRFQEVPSSPPQLRKEKAGRPARAPTKRIPAADHPWRRLLWAARQATPPLGHPAKRSG